MYNAFDVIQKNVAPLQVSNGVGGTTKYEGKDNAPMPYFKQSKKKQQKEEKKEKPKSDSKIDFLA